MDHREPTPWHPDPAWARRLLAGMGTLILLVLAMTWAVRSRQPARAPQRISMEGRAQEWAAGLQSMVPGGMKAKPRTAAVPRQPWDRALAAVLVAEQGDLERARPLALEGPEPGGPAGAAFREAWKSAYLGGPTVPSPSTRVALRTALGQGYGAWCMDARLAERAGESPAAARQAAEVALGSALVKAVLLGLGVITGILTGVIVLVVLLVHREPPRVWAPPVLQMSGHALALVLMGWFLAFLASGWVVGFLVGAWPSLRVVALPLQYALHATAGLMLLKGAEGCTWRVLYRRWCPTPTGPAVAWGLGFYAVALVVVLALALVLSPVMPKDGPAQKELLELLSSLHGLVPILLVALTVAGMAPLFEEILFRGALLPWAHGWLGARLSPRWTAVGSVVLSGTLFGAIHLQPLAMPVLSTLGIVLGAAMLRTRNLWTAVVVHACWNGGTFLLLQLFA